ncbi:MAG: 16S rRNA pseudouridine(516) synthase [Clostridiales bacterium GWB2_37_7]|nr:MAG: 16S rRNA pseudouridine(516) synthase [Clostridiales bacterium GWB2_37_7]
MSKRQRLDKILSNLGFGTRKEVKDLIKSGAIEIDGVIAKDVGLQVDPLGQNIKVNNKELVYREVIYIMMNKPQGVVSATEDKRDTTVVDLLEDSLQAFQPAPVGRLDKDTEGLLLITNDGQLAHKLLSPKKHVPKTYFAHIEGRVGELDIRAFEQGITLDDGYTTLPAQLKVLTQGEISQVEIIIYEGKFHQIKRMFQAVDKKVVYLKRIAMGRLQLDESLDIGKYRELREDELSLLQDNDGMSN